LTLRALVHDTGTKANCFVGNDNATGRVVESSMTLVG